MFSLFLLDKAIFNYFLAHEEIVVTYLLFLSVEKDFTVKVGKLGKVTFDNGLYVYVGSAKNSIKRVLRHFKKKKKVHWHIDYLTSHKNCKALFAYLIEKDEESKIANYLSKYYKPVIGFGSSDTNDISHLFKLN